MSLFSPHTSLAGNPIAFSGVLSSLTASLSAQTHSPLLDGEGESSRRLVSQRQVSDSQPASSRNFSSTTSCVSFPYTPLSVVCWGPVLLAGDTKRPTEEGQTPPPPHLSSSSALPITLALIHPFFFSSALILHRPNIFFFMHLNISLSVPFLVHLA